MRRAVAAGWVPLVVLTLLLAACGMRTDRSAFPYGAGNGSNASSNAGGNQDNSSNGSATDTGAGTGNSAAASETGAASASSGAATPAGAGASAGANTPAAVGSSAGASRSAAAQGAAAASPARSSNAGQAAPSAARPGSGEGTASAQQPGQAAGNGSASSSGAGAKTGTLPGSINAPGPDAQGVSADKFRIGVIAPISGAAGFLGQSAVDGINAFTNMKNAAGGVAGRKYQLVIGDSQFDQAVEATVAKRLVEKDKVFMLMSVAGDSEAAYVTSVGIPHVTLGVMPPAYSSKYPTTYPLVMPIVDFVTAMAYQLHDVLKLPIKTTAILYGNQNFAWAKWAKYAKKAWEYFGVDVKSMDQFDISNGDCTSIVLKMKSLNIDFWQVAQSVGWPLCQQAMARQNYTPPLGRGGPFTATYNYVSQAGLAMDGVYGEDYGVQIGHNTCEPYTYEPGTDKAPECQNYIHSMKQYATDASIESLEDVWAQLFWTGGKLIDDAIRHQSGAMSWAGINRWIQGQDHWLSGLAPPIRFTPNCKTGSSWWIFQWKSDGKKLVQTDWHQYGGSIKVPLALKNHVFPGAGDCYATAMADAEL